MATDTRRRDRDPPSPPDDVPVRTHGPSGGHVTESEFYDVVGNDRRRACVRYLLGTTGETSVSELVSYVVDREVDARNDHDGVDAVDASHRKSVYSSLRQTHLPLLVDYGIVRFDPDENRVEPAPSIAAFEDDDTGTPLPGSWPWTYVALGLLAIAWFTAGIFDVISLTDRRFLLISLGYVVLVFLEGLWEVQQLRQALDSVADGR